MRPRNIPINEIRYTAKMGFLSRAIWEDYFSKKSRTQNMRIWRSFVKEKYFAQHDSARMQDVLILGPRGKKLIEDDGGEIVSPPHFNQIHHDEIVSRIALELINSKSTAALHTEGELKRKYMGWLKKTREGREAKLPDLLIELQCANRTLNVAIEVELSKKNPDRYRKVMNSYANQKTAQRVVFISDNENIFERLGRAMKETYYPSNEKPIGFSQLSDWQANPLTATIRFNNHNTTLEKMSFESQKIAS